MSGRRADQVGFVVIGRNEGARLVTCLDSVAREGVGTVYVDSGSMDDSVAMARARGIPVVELDRSRPFTAARARNAGADRLCEEMPGLSLVHFIDGDCELVPGWLDGAVADLSADPQVGVVCGRRRERYPDVSPYNQLCDNEWNTPIGTADTCGGDALYRIEALRDGGGFSPELIAGEEPDLCHRIRAAGWRIMRLDREMTIHDAAMTRFGQWWQRNRRSGYATAEALTRYGKGDRRILREVVSNTLWALPVAWPLWPILWLRVAKRRGSLEATYITLGKLPHLQGQIDFWRRRRSRLIEYK